MGKSGRHKRAKPGHAAHQGGSKRRHPGGGGRRHGAGGWAPAAESDDDGPGGTLHIGGVVVRVDAVGNGIAQTAGAVPLGQRRQRRRGSAGSLLPPPPPLRRRHSSSSGGTSASGDGSSSEEEEGRVGDEAMEDYIANLGAGASEGSGHSSDGGASHSSGSQADVEGAHSGGGGSVAKRRRQAYEQYEVLRRFSGFEMGDEGPPEGLGWPGFSSEDNDDSSSTSSDGSGSSSSGDGDGSSDSSGSSSSGSDGSSSSEEDGDDGSSSDEDGELMEADLEQLSLAQRYPVQVRPRPPPLPGQQQSGKQAGGSGKGKKKSKSAVKGAKGGKLAPGEKKRLKKERMEAKRAARAAARGFDLAWVNRQLEEFVARQGDLQAFGPCGKHEGKAVARLAALYGCRTSLQGSKSNRKLVMVSSTPRTCLPQGADLLAISQILAAQSAAERTGASMDGRLAAAVAGADLSSVLPPALVAAGSSRGRWAGVQRSGGGTGEGGAKKTAKKRRSKLKPVAFVSEGEEEAAYASDEASEEERSGLGSGRALYTRMTALSLQGPAPPAAAGSSPRSARGGAAAESITNPGRLLGLGLALGIGAEVFGAPGPAQAGSPSDMAADLLPLSPLLSKSQLRKLQRRASGGGAAAAAASAALGSPSAGLAAAAASSGGKQHQQSGCKGEPGRSKQERRARGGSAPALGEPAAVALAPISSEEEWQQQQQQQQQRRPGLGAGGGGGEGGSKGSGRALTSGEYGDFERHTTGIGSKLLAKWGFAGEGAGLGRAQQGRAEPLQAVRRAKRQGLGAER
ncbi:hypothetical protein ABPG75_003981 [Micractinium tetrahymenae]